MTRRKFLHNSAALVAAVAAPTVFANETTLKLIIPQPAGGVTDAIARLITDSMSATLRRPVICENRPGAAGLIGINALQSQGANGNALLLVNHGFVSLPLLSLAAKYDVLADFKPVAQLCTAVSMLMINGGVPAKNMFEFLAWAKLQPHGVNASNSGAGTAGHIATMMFAKRAGIKVNHIPYKGTSETSNALLSGEVHMQLTTATAALFEQTATGKVRALAVTPNVASPLVPGVPPISQSVPGYSTPLPWFGLISHKGIPDALNLQYSAAVETALKEPGVKEKYAATFMEVEYLAPHRFRSEIEKSTIYWKDVVAELNLKPI